MENIIFICIGTDKLLTDSFGPRVGERLKQNFKENNNIKIFGTLKEPIHLKNAPILYRKLKNNKNQIILIDSAFGNRKYIGGSFINLGGMKIGNAYGKGFYFPATMNIKTVVASKNYIPNWTIKQIDFLAENVAEKVTKGFFNFSY